METTSTPVKEAMQFRLNFGLLTEIIKKKQKKPSTHTHDQGF